MSLNRNRHGDLNLIIDFNTSYREIIILKNPKLLQSSHQIII